ncbi:hypothetical protein NPIL_479791 [Nephila pilipes]|uniref:Uncharacterized protein n=1 Tax=Nephila pilipes TaxID=299642 RepID=A0A8X6UPM6_NEPPI|nr:hypothetical protein NPIL_163511 [Nephila pilipes]GFU35079.1 hypothetical protein NPIL_479791 [Nephila pilipes]
MRAHRPCTGSFHGKADPRDRKEPHERGLRRGFGSSARTPILPQTLGKHPRLRLSQSFLPPVRTDPAGPRLLPLTLGGFGSSARTPILPQTLRKQPRLRLSQQILPPVLTDPAGRRGTPASPHHSGSTHVSAGADPSIRFHATRSPVFTRAPAILRLPWVVWARPTPDTPPLGWGAPEAIVREPLRTTEWSWERPGDESPRAAKARRNRSKMPK